MARELRLDIDGSSAGANRSLDEAAASVALLAREANKLGDEFRKAGRDATELDAKLAATRLEAAALAKQFAESGDAGVKKQLDSQRAAASELERLRKDVIGSTEKDAKRTATAWENAFKDFDKLSKAEEKAVKEASAPLNSISPANLGGGITGPVGIGAIGLAAQPALSAAGGAISLGVTAGVVGAGVAGAAMGDPAEFSARWGAATGELKAKFLEATAVFRGPTLAAIDSIRQTIAGWNLAGIFSDAVPYLMPLVHGAEQFAGYLLEAVASLVHNAGPVIAEFAADLPQIGAAIAQSMEMISSQSAGGAQSLHEVIVAVESLIVGFGLLVSGAEGFASGMTSITNSVKNFFDGVPTWIQVALPLVGIWRSLFDAVTPTPLNESADAANKFGHALSGVNTATDGSVGKMDDLGVVGGHTFMTLDQQVRDTAAALARMNNEFDKSISDALSLSNADIGVAQSFSDLTAQFKKGSEALDINTQKGRDNLNLINSTVAALQKDRDAAIAAGGGTADAYAKANATYSAQLGHLEQMLEKLGLSKQAAQQLLAAFQDKTFTVTENFHVKTSMTGPVSAQGVISGGVPALAGSAYASGTKNAPGGWALVGEEGPEIVRLPAGAEVLNAPDSRRAMAGYGSATSAASSGSTGGTAVTFGGDLNSAFASAFMMLVRIGAIQISTGG